MKIKEIQDEIKGIDVYLLDQILKGRYNLGDSILDAGCGLGRNLKHFIEDDFFVYGIDKESEVINKLNRDYSDSSNVEFHVSELEEVPFESVFFDHVICNAVLHFAKSNNQFWNMIDEMCRVLKPGGTLFVRMTSVFGIEDKIERLSEGVYKIPDGTTRFLLTENLLKPLVTNYHLEFVEPLKTVNVNNVRCMSNLVLRKM